MENITDLDNSTLIEAVMIWTGYGISTMPYMNDKRMIERFGDNEAAKLIIVVKKLKSDFYLSKANMMAENIQEMGLMSADDFKNKHPDLPGNIGEAFAWCYTFDFK
jgi:hypothetical protein